ncbi:transposase [Streptomyces europaeiscabiei]|uniref:Transposase n=1 Tax=Streptomyces europaeiscabiei TaxID=146819 RepID=A0AAJ2PQ19_9ACTN|nr:transposase [Streptomyces europaeiscabiei]MDX3131259.1 transposase [Streptomyces europaeiscabiei]
MTRSAKGTVERPGQNVAQKSGLNRSILAQGWGLLRQRTGHKAPGRVEDVPAPYTSLRCSACGWIDTNSRKSQAEFVCSFCGFTCNADTNASINIAAGQGGIPRPRRTAGAGGTTPPNRRSSVREPQPEWVGMPSLLRGGCQSGIPGTCLTLGRPAHAPAPRPGRPGAAGRFLLWGVAPPGGLFPDPRKGRRRCRTPLIPRPPCLAPEFDV